MLTALKIYLAIGALLAAAAVPHVKPSRGFRDWADMVGFIIATISFALAYPIYFIWGARRG